jgi:Siphovirus-type tail component, C-terminal domain
MVPGQLRYGGLFVGAGTPYRWRKLTGWEELPELDSGNVPRPDADGAYLGRLLSQTRTIGLDEMVVRAPGEQLGTVIEHLGALRGPVDTPRLTNTTTGAVLEYEAILDPGEQLTIDTFAGTATLPGGESLLNAASVASWPEPAFTLAPGRNQLTFRAAPDGAADPRATAVLRWHYAHW